MTTNLPRTPFARIFPEMGTLHRFEKAREWNELPVCVRCGGMEGSLLATCPIQRMTMVESDLAYHVFCERSTANQEELKRRRELEIENGEPLVWAASIAEYNQSARAFNDNLLDLTLAERAKRVKRVAGVIAAKSGDVVEMTLL